MRRCQRFWTLVFVTLQGVIGLQAQSAEAPGFTMALTGDSIITRRLSVYREPEYVRMLELLRSADVAFTNLEVLFHDYEPHPMHQSGGVWMRADPELAKELVWAGIDLVARANNHSGDYGVLGIELTTRYVEEAGLVQAGVGNSLREAREARFLETARGRVALISMASTFPDHSRAGNSWGDTPPRPGLSPLRFSTSYQVTRDQMEQLKEFAQQAGIGAAERDGELTFLRNRFVLGDRPDVLTVPHAQDLAEIAGVVKSASQLADYTIVTIHAHEGDRSRSVPAKFLVTFARAMVDAGADVFVGHGPHVLRAVEIYKGKPILYSLGDFIFQNETLQRLAPENYEAFEMGSQSNPADFNNARYDFDRRGFPATPEIWEAVVAEVRWRGKELDEVRLHPISLGFGKPPAERGRPKLAGPDLSRKIINDLIRLSEPFGTRIEFEDGVGIVRPALSTNR